MKIHKLDEVMQAVREKLDAYLEMHGTEFNGTHFTCFPEDTQVRTTNGYLPIIELKKGDNVYSLNGKINSVNNVFKQKYNGELIKISTRTPKKIVCTKNHNFYVISKKQLSNPYYRDYKPEIKKASKLTLDDYLLAPISKDKKDLKTIQICNNNIKIDRNFLLMLGLYLAEGSTNYQKTKKCGSVVFSFNIKEKLYINFIKNCAKKYFNIDAKEYSYKDKHVTRVYLCNVELTKWFLAFKNKDKKQLPDKIFTKLSFKQLKYILLGWYLGDGNKRNSRIGCTIATRMIDQLYYSALVNKFYPSVWLVKRPNRRISYSMIMLMNLKNKKRKRTRGLDTTNFQKYKLNSLYIENNGVCYYLQKIRNIKKYKDNLYVYNLNVANEHNYCIENNIIVKNCPNRAVHKNEDYKPSCAHFPNPDAFKCFACSLSGDIFTACHYLEGKPLTGQGFIMDNVLYLADLFNIPYEVAEYTPEEKKKEALYKALEDTCKIANQVIKIDNEKTKKVREYVGQRNWDDMVDIFQFGYCNYKKLIELLKKKGHLEETLKEVGLIPSAEAKGNQSKYLLDDRLLFPIKNHYGRIVGFASRGLNKDSNEQKYLNSRNTVLYNKTSVLFNLDKARLNSDVYIVEGYADVFTLYKYGIKNVVALCGLSFNEARYKLLVKQGVTKVIFCLDSDSAGKQALTRIIDKDIKGCSGISLFVKEIPAPYKDVDELLVKEGVKIFHEIKELSVFDWKLSLLKKDKENDFIKNDIIKLIVLEEDYTKKEKLCQRLAKVLEVSKEAVKKETEKHDLLDRGRRLITSEDIQEEDKCFERVLSDWDRGVWNRRGSLLGLDAKKFPFFIKKMDGIQNMFYILAGDTNIGKCLAGDTEILLNTGEIVKLKDLKNNKNNKVISYNRNTNLFEAIKFKSFYENGVKPIYEIKLQSGKTLKATANHPLLMLDGWKELKDIKVGQFIATPRLLPFFGNIKVLNDNKIKLLSYFTAEGCLTKKITFTNTNKMIVNDFKKVLKKEFPEVGYYVEKGMTYCTNNNKRLKNFLKKQQQFGKKSINKNVPVDIYKSSKKDIALYLRYLFDCDGSIYKSSGKYLRIEITLGSEQLAKDIINLLQRFVVFANIRDKKFMFNNKPYTAYEVTIRDIESIRKFIKVIGFFSKQKRALKLLREYKLIKSNGRHDVIPVNKKLIKYLVNVKENSGKTWKNFADYCNLNGGKGNGFINSIINNKRTSLSRQKLLEFAKYFKDNYILKLVNTNILWDKVKSINYIGKQPTFDIEVPRNHNFIANNIIVHNSAMLLNLARDVIESNENIFVLFFSVDDSISQLLPRMISVETGIPINAISNPKYKIKLKDGLAEAEKERLLKLRSEEIEKLKSMSDRFAIKEEADAKRIEQLTKYIKIYKKISEGKQLVVFVDNLHRLSSYKKANTRELYMMISDQLKYWKNQYDIPIITTAELRKTNAVRRPIGDDIKETKDLQFDADFVGLLYSEYYLNPNTGLKFVRDVNAVDAYGPVVELNVIKNKTSSFKSRVYYKFYPELSKFIECTEEERNEYLEQGF